MTSRGDLKVHAPLNILYPKTGWLISGVLLTAIGLFTDGCSRTAAQLSSPARIAASTTNPSLQVFQHCRELVCTNADLPYCEFEDTYASSSNLPLTDRIHCSRSQFGTDCEERHFPVGGENQALQSQVLKFRCGGDPVECWLIGGNATWETTLERRVSGGSGQSYSCKPGKKSPEPAPQQVPGPDTVRRGTFTTANG